MHPDELELALDRETVRSYDADGRLHVQRTNISKANVCDYMGSEIPGYQQLGLDANRVYRMYRDPEELAKAAPTFANLPLLQIHVPINAAHHRKEVVVGTVGTDVAFDGAYLTSSLAVWDAAAIRLVESKKLAQISCGYRFRADMSPGKTTDGVAYDGVMRDIMGNHVALVERGRAGPDVIVADSKPLELPKMKRSALVAALVAALGSSVTVSDEQKLALDAALDTALAKEPPKPDPVAMDAAISAAITAGGYVTKADAQTMANDAASAAVARVNALHKAREDVKPLVGIVAMDSAEAVYRFALEKEGVPLTDVPAAAFPVLVDQVKQRKAASAAAIRKDTPAIALDAALSVDKAIPALAAFQTG